MPAAGSSQGWLVTFGEENHPFSCTVCRGKLFADREVKLNTSGAELFGVGWANHVGQGPRLPAMWLRSHVHARNGQDVGTPKGVLSGLSKGLSAPVPRFAAFASCL